MFESFSEETKKKLLSYPFMEAYSKGRIEKHVFQERKN